MTRTTSALGAYLMREVPARSAARYVHQLQKNATILGSKPSGIGQYPFDFLEDLLVFKQILPHGAGWAGHHAGAASLAQRLVDSGFMNLAEERNGVIGTHGDTGLASAANLLHHVGGIGLGLDISRIDQGQSFGGGGAGLGHGFAYRIIIWRRRLDHTV